MKYQEEGGYDRMQLDLEIAMEISAQIADSSKRSGADSDAQGMVARRNQRRSARKRAGPSISDGDLLGMLTEE